MKVVVLGSGLLGITTAYVLASRGHDVEVIERQDKSAAETSFANGGQLSYSHAEPWGTPEVLCKLPKWLFHEESPLIFRPRADWPMIVWGLKFLRQCTAERARINCVNMLRLGLYSREKMAQLRADTNVAFDFQARGIVHIFEKQQDLDHAVKHAEFQAKFGCKEEVLSTAEILAREPALAQTERKIIGGTFSPEDESGDPFLFCNNLAALIQQKYGVKIHYGTNIESLESSGDRVTGVKTSRGVISADSFVLALGSYSQLFSKSLGFKLPIYPMKGYSITVPANEHTPNMSVTDGTYKIVYSRLGDRLRVAGTAEFAGHNTDIRESRITPIVRAASKLLPKCNWSAEIKKWACLRPSTPTGAPIFGKSPYRNLFLNTGHGTLGWTQAAGSAYIVADIMENKTPEILMSGLTWEGL